MNSIIHTATVSIVVVATALAGYHRFVVAPAALTAVVDLESIISECQAELQPLLIKAASDQERAAIQQQAALFPRLLQTAVGELAAECRCQVLDRTVLLTPRPGTLDLTAQLKSKVLK